MQPQVNSPELNDSPVRAFLSFTTSDKPLVEDFREQISLRFTNLDLLDHAVTDQYDKNWKLECAKKIDRSILMICLIGRTTHRSNAVAWEIDRGLLSKKRILAFNLTDQGVRLPEVLIRNSISLSPYNDMNAIYASLSR